MKKFYPTDMTDEQWELIQPLLPPDKTTGRPRTTDLRAVVNAIFYIVVAGCAWLMLPKDFPPSKTVYHYFRAWRLDKTWERIHHKFVEWERVAQGREAVPSAASMDSQSVKTATIAATPVGYDGGKKKTHHSRHTGISNDGGGNSGQH
jgi:transposase